LFSDFTGACRPLKSKVLTVSREEILHQIKLSCQIPFVIEGIATRKILASTAAEVGIKVEPEELQQAADNIRLLTYSPALCFANG
jgi:hypothetical protein